LRLRQRSDVRAWHEMLDRYADHEDSRRPRTTAGCLTPTGISNSPPSPRRSSRTSRRQLASLSETHPSVARAG
jgi:hypothetical protein